jgi:hypothetical protein
MGRGTPVPRRAFLGTLLRAGVVLPALGGRGWAEPLGVAPKRLPALRPPGPDPARRWRGDSSLAAALRAGEPLPSPDLRHADAEGPPGSSPAERFSDLKRHFIFEYYPWYGGPPSYLHWDYLDRHPPLDLASHYVPRLGPYDVRSRAVLEQQARWISEAGVGAIALSWWGRGSYEDRAVPLVMDVMGDHDVKVTFALESYTEDRGRRFADDVLYLLGEYGEKRRWDAFLLPRDEDGSEGPVFKGFRCILPPTSTDCHGVTSPVPDYTPDAVWREQTDRLRNTLKGDFPHITLLADSLEFKRTPDSGFDGIGIYDNFIGPEKYAGYAGGASRAGLIFSFNVNPGYDQIEPRVVEAGSCYAPRPFAPASETLDWSRAEDRERAARLSEERIRASFDATLAVQTDPTLTNARRGVLFVYINSFNEWHEGHAVEPMMDATDLLPEERALGYHNPARGGYRLAALAERLRSLKRPPANHPPPPGFPRPPVPTLGSPAVPAPGSPSRQ